MFRKNYKQIATYCMIYYVSKSKVVHIETLHKYSLTVGVQIDQGLGLGPVTF